VITETKSSPRIEVPPSDIAAHFGELLEDGAGCDVTFRVRGEAISAHRFVLAARSPVFRAQLFGSMREATKAPQQHVTIRGVQPAVFRSLLHFIYTDSLPATTTDLKGDQNTEMIRHLLVAADRYAMERLKLVCQSMLCENLSVGTVATTLALADQHNCDKLKDACLQFIACSDAMDTVVETRGYKKLKVTAASLIVDALEKRMFSRRA
jgi:speckle-type POZ protein